jgi:hypothetical protein
MKMGTTRLPWHCDAAALHAPWQPKLGRPAIWRFASSGGIATAGTSAFNEEDIAVRSWYK